MALRVKSSSKNGHNEIGRIIPIFSPFALAFILGKNRATLAVLTYLLQGAIGLPVFATGNFGILYLLGPSGGYLWGFAAATYLTGHLFERARGQASYKIFLSILAGNGVIYLLGAAQLSLFLGCRSALLFGVLPFLFTDMLKSLFLYQGVLRLSPNYRSHRK